MFYGIFALIYFKWILIYFKCLAILFHSKWPNDSMYEVSLTSDDLHYFSPFSCTKRQIVLKEEFEKGNPSKHINIES